MSLWRFPSTFSRSSVFLEDSAELMAIDAPEDSHTVQFRRQRFRDGGAGASTAGSFAVLAKSSTATRRACACAIDGSRPITIDNSRGGKTPLPSVRRQRLRISRPASPTNP